MTGLAQVTPIVVVVKQKRKEKRLQILRKLRVIGTLKVITLKRIILLMWQVSFNSKMNRINIKLSNHT